MIIHRLNFLVPNATDEGISSSEAREFCFQLDVLADACRLPNERWIEKASGELIARRLTLPNTSEIVLNCSETVETVECSSVEIILRPTNGQKPGSRKTLNNEDLLGKLNIIVEYAERAPIIQSKQISHIDHVALAVPPSSGTPGKNLQLAGLWLTESLNLSVLKPKNSEKSYHEVLLPQEGMLMMVLESVSLPSYPPSLPSYIVLVEPLTEPFFHYHSGQVLNFNAVLGPGLQHFALHSQRLPDFVNNLKSHKLKFQNSAVEPLRICPPSVSPEEAAKAQGILVHKRLPEFPNQTLYQIFCSEFNSLRCPMFLELIERVGGYPGFAVGNVRSLLESQDRNQRRFSVLFVDEILDENTIRVEFEKLSSRFDVSFHYSHANCRNEEELINFLRQQSGNSFDCLSSSFVPISSAVLQLARPALVLAQGSGSNHVDREACRVQNIDFFNHPDWGTEDVSEHVIAAIYDASCLAKYRNLTNWERIPKRCVQQKTLGIVGFGRIGRSLLKKALAASMKVILFDLLPIEKVEDSNGSVKVATTLNELLNESDFVSLHIPLTATTRSFVNKEFLGKMKPGATLINYSRGDILCEQSVVEAIEEGRLGYFYTDVACQEPAPADHPFWRNPRIFVTPHIAALSVESQAKAALAIIQSIVMHFSKKTAVTENFPIATNLIARPRTMRDVYELYVRHNPAVFNLAAGLVEFRPPKRLIECVEDYAREHPGIHMYRERQGETLFRESLLGLLQKGGEFHNLQTENLLATSGVTGAFAAFLSMIREGHTGKLKIGLFEPFYPFHLEMLSTVLGENFEVQFFSLKFYGNSHSRLIDSISFEQFKELNALILSNPLNPTGYILDEEEMKIFSEWLKAANAQNSRKVSMFLDEVYSELLSPDRDRLHQESIDLKDFPSDMVICRGFSKVLAVGSWRLGYCIATPQMIERLLFYHDRYFISCSWLQLPLAEYLKNSYEDFLSSVNSNKSLLAANRQTLSKAFQSSLDWQIIQYPHGMYIILKHASSNDLEAFHLILNRCGVAVAPGAMFFRPENFEGEKFIRIHLAIPEEKALKIAQRIQDKSFEMIKK